MLNINMRTKEVVINKKSDYVFLHLAVFFILFIFIAIGLYFWWLNPWTNGARAMNNYPVDVPGVDITDSDGDGLTLRQEVQIGTNDDLKDSDKDGLDDNLELKYGTSPLIFDTDKDGYSDGIEIMTGYNPLKK